MVVQRQAGARCECYDYNPLVVVEIQTEDLDVDTGPTVSLISGISDALMVSGRFWGFAANGSAVPVEIVAGPGTIV